MKKVFNKLPVAAMVAATLLVASCSKHNDGYGHTPAPLPTVNALVFTAAGDSAGIVSKLNEFRQLAGSTINTVPGATSGRREVNWDGVPANVTNNNNYPFDFFGSADPGAANGRKRGLILTNTGTSFRVDSTDFSEVDASYATQFEAFSRKRLFAYLGNNVTEVTFKVAGTNTNAFVKGFGVIFSDVDLLNSTFVEYFAGTKSLGIYQAKVAAQGFSFVGVIFPDEHVTSLKITCGNGLLAPGSKDVSNGGNKDLVVMDDFFYDEPKQGN